MPFRLIALAHSEEEPAAAWEEAVRRAAGQLRPPVIFTSPHPSAQAAARILAQELGAERVEVVPEFGLDPQETLESVRERRPGLREVLGGILRRRPPRPRVVETVGRTGLEIVDEKLTELWEHHRRELVFVASARLVEAYLRAHSGYRPEEAGRPVGAGEMVVATYPDPLLGGRSTAEFPARGVEVPLGTLERRG